MKTEKNILIAFILNFTFAVFEGIGGIFTGSVAILSDAIHDMGDAISIGISFFLENKSKRSPDEIYTYGYARYSVIGSVVTTLILLWGSVSVICHAVQRLWNPVEIRYDGMILLALIGVFVNFAAAFVTRGGASFNQKAINLHMLEDTLGWSIVLVGAFVMRFTGYAIIDPLMSIGLGIFISIRAVKNLRRSMDPFLEKIPCGINLSQIHASVSSVKGVLDVHHLHVWSLDGQHHCATMHLIVCDDPCDIKGCVREVLAEQGIGHVTIETESEDEHCQSINCCIKYKEKARCSHHHKH